MLIVEGGDFQFHIVIQVSTLSSAMSMVVFLKLSYDQGQERIQDLKKEGTQGVRRLAPKIFFANLGHFV